MKKLVLLFVISTLLLVGCADSSKQTTTDTVTEATNDLCEICGRKVSEDDYANINSYAKYFHPSCMLEAMAKGEYFQCCQCGYFMPIDCLYECSGNICEECAYTVDGTCGYCGEYITSSEDSFSVLDFSSNFHNKCAIKMIDEEEIFRCDICGGWYLTEDYDSPISHMCYGCYSMLKETEVN